MLTPTWESAPGALAALLNGAGGGASAALLDMEDLYTITLQGGQVLRYTSGLVLRTVAGNTWLTGPLLKRSRLKWGVGITVDTLTVNISARPDVLVNGVPFMRFIAAGGLAGAQVLLERLFSAPGAAQPTGMLHRFGGRVADIGGGRHERTLTVRSTTELLDKMVPADLYQPGCKNEVFDPLCGLVRAVWQVAGTASAASNTLRTAFAHALPQPLGYFDLGVLTITSGPNAGVKRTVREYTPDLLTVAAPWPFPVSAGTTFTVLPGCDKQQATCSAKFNNLPGFRGEPYIPAPDTVT